ncbi:MAG TPA: amidase domain-containing protein [Firmicutes bacterium]|nr:amidase domain-containing protein [Bacillota bacterium]
MKRRVRARAAYNRSAAVSYALRHVFNPNPEFANMDTLGGGGDCTNFVSQCLLAGGWRMDYRATGFDSEWWYRRRSTQPFDGDQRDWWSCTWSLPSLFILYLSLYFGQRYDLLARPSRARLLRLGDIIFYDWDGDGFYDHSVIVTRRINGWPYVTYRTLKPLDPIRNAYWRLRFRGRARSIIGLRLVNNPDWFTSSPDWNVLVPCDRSRAGMDDEVEEPKEGELAEQTREQV